MYFVGNEFKPDEGGYKTLAQAKKQAEKKNMKVFDTDGAVVWPEAAVEEQEAAETSAEEATAAETAETEAGVNNSAEEENAENGANNEATAANNGALHVMGVELTDDVQEGTLEENQDGNTNVYNEAGEKVGTVDKETMEKLREEAGKAFVIGTVEVIYKGMIALRNAPKWGDGYKCGIAKTGYKAEVVRKEIADGSTLYQLINGKWISGKTEHVKFTAAE